MAREEREREGEEIREFLQKVGGVKDESWNIEIHRASMF